MMPCWLTGGHRYGGCDQGLAMCRRCGYVLTVYDEAVADE